METIKIMSSVYPEKPLAENYWMKKFKVSSRVKDKYQPGARVEYIMSQYNNDILCKMIKSEEKPTLIQLLKKLLAV